MRSLLKKFFQKQILSATNQLPSSDQSKADHVRSNAQTVRGPKTERLDIRQGLDFRGHDGDQLRMCSAN